MSASLPCTFCGDKVDVDHPHYRRVHGWERDRAQGGANQITLRQTDEDQVACDLCIRRQRSGVASGQEAML